MAAVKAGSCMPVVFLFLFGICGISFTQATRLERPKMDNPPLFNMPKNRMSFPNFHNAFNVKFPKGVDFFGSTYQDAFISPNGFIGFADGIDFQNADWKEGVRNPSTDLPFMAPFYYRAFDAFNVDSERYQGRIYHATIQREDVEADENSRSEDKYLLEYLTYYVKEAVLDAPSDFQADTVLMVTWQNVAAEPNATYKNEHTSDNYCTDEAPCEGATFQAVLINDNKNHRTAAIFSYKDMGIVSADDKEYFQAGFNGGYGRGWYNVIPCHGDCKLNMDQATINHLPYILGSDMEGRFILDIGGEIVVRGGCLSDNLKAGMLEVFPTSVGMFGGEKLEMSGHCMPGSAAKFFCKFGYKPDDPVTEGIMLNSMKGYCEVPMLTKIGEMRVYWSSDGVDWSMMNRQISVVLPSRMEPSVAVDARVSSPWYQRNSTKIIVPWDPAKFCDSSSAMVDVNLIGYRELEEEGKVEYKLLTKLGEVENNHGSFEFNVEDHHCKEDCKAFEMGFLEVRLHSNYLGNAKERVAVRHGVMPLGWYVNSALTKSMGSDWSNEMCQSWYDKDSQEEEWVEQLLPCPCSLDQALADFGRWQPDPGCNLFTGSKCTYHIGAKHCVRSVVPISEAGNQCCYNQDHTLRYSQLTYQGSTPDRSHNWGTAPYDTPNTVPSLSHWKHDVVSFYYCCLWNEYKMCDLYMEQRPTRDCKNYEAPGLAYLRGDPHITTFDGQTYHFGGFRDYFLLINEDINIQGRFTPRAHSWDIGVMSGGATYKPSALTSVAIFGTGKIIEIHPAPETATNERGLDIRLGAGQERKFFLTKSTLWQDFGGQSIVNNVMPGETNRHDNFTILTVNNIGINVYSKNGLLHVTVALPASMKSESGGMGLFGKYDGDPGNDFTSKSGGIISPGSDKETLFDSFASTWGVTEQSDTIFPYYQAPGNKRPKYFVYDDIPRQFPEAPTVDRINNVCDGDSACTWDYRVTGDAEVARTTKSSDELFNYARSSAVLVENCGLPGVGMMAELSAYNFSVGQKIDVLGCDDKRAFQGETSFECVKERLENAEAEERADYGERRTASDGTEYIIHWVPKPYEVCVDQEEASSGLAIEVIIGIAVAAGVLVIVAIILVILLMRWRKSHSGSMNGKPKAKDRRSRDSDPQSGHAMLGQDKRSPVYKPSQEPLKMSQTQGSAV